MIFIIKLFIIKLFIIKLFIIKLSSTTSVRLYIKSILILAKTFSGNLPLLLYLSMSMAEAREDSAISYYYFSFGVTDSSPSCFSGKLPHIYDRNWLSGKFSLLSEQTERLSEDQRLLLISYTVSPRGKFSESPAELYLCPHSSPFSEPFHSDFRHIELPKPESWSREDYLLHTLTGEINPLCSKVRLNTGRWISFNQAAPARIPEPDGLLILEIPRKTQKNHQHPVVSLSQQLKKSGAMLYGGGSPWRPDFKPGGGPGQTYLDFFIQLVSLPQATERWENGLPVLQLSSIDKLMVEIIDRMGNTAVKYYPLPEENREEVIPGILNLPETGNTSNKRSRSGTGSTREQPARACKQPRLGSSNAGHPMGSGSGGGDGGGEDEQERKPLPARCQASPVANVGSENQKHHTYAYIDSEDNEHIIDLISDNEELLEELTCSICFNICRDASTICTDHFLCDYCIKGGITREPLPACPICRFEGGIQPNPRWVRKFINKLIVRCPYAGDGCPEGIKIGDLGRHCERCRYKIRECPNDYCDFSGTTEQLMAHQNNCGSRWVSCNNQGCHAMYQYFDQPAHEESCEYKELHCANDGCTASFLRKDQQWHDARCEYALEPCDNKGCGSRVARYEMALHKMEHCEYQLFACEYCHEKQQRRLLEAHKEMCNDRPVLCEFCSVRAPSWQMPEHLAACIPESSTVNQQSMVFIADQFRLASERFRLASERNKALQRQGDHLKEQLEQTKGELGWFYRVECSQHRHRPLYLIPSTRNVYSNFPHDRAESIFVIESFDRFYFVLTEQETDNLKAGTLEKVEFTFYLYGYHVVARVGIYNASEGNDFFSFVMHLIPGIRDGIVKWPFSLDDRVVRISLLNDQGCERSRTEAGSTIISQIYTSPWYVRPPTSESEPEERGCKFIAPVVRDDSSPSRVIFCMCFE